MKTFRLFLAVVCGASLGVNLARAFTISSVTFSPGDVVPAGTRLEMIVDIVTPSQGTWLWAPTQVSTNSSGGIRVDIYPTSGPLTAIGALRETVDLGTPEPGLYHYEVAIHPNFTVHWGTRTNRGIFIVQREVLPGQLMLTEPGDGEQFTPGETIRLRATTTNEGGPWHVEFLSGNRRISTSTPNQPVWWSEAWGGQHVVSARATNPRGTTLTSGSATIQVGPGPTLPVVRISASPWTTAEPCPTCLVAPSTITIHRTEPTNTALTVALDIGGTAAPGEDYHALHLPVTIRAGERSVQRVLLPKDDQLVEGPEVVRVRLVSSPNYLTASHGQEALVVIRDDEPNAPTARLDIIAPANESRFVLGRTIELSALAVNLDNEVYGPVEFYAGDELVARSQVTATARPAIPGLPSIHTAYWTNPPVGQHSLTARTRLSFSESITSPPVRITVDSSGLPIVRLETSPPANEALEFCPPNALCAYPSFVVRRTGPTSAELPVFLSYSGTATAEADYPELPSTVVIPANRDAAFVMVVPKDDTLVEGPETIVARFTPVPGAGYFPDPAFSEATITITDNDLPGPTVVSIRAEDSRATELPPWVDAIDHARFRVSRTGDRSSELLVFFSVGGSASPGADYQELNSPVVIAAGESSVTLDVVPIHDELREGMETVFVRLEPSHLLNPLPQYDIDLQEHFAVAAIFDGLVEPGPAIEIVSPEEGDRFRLPGAIDIIVAAYHPARDIGGIDLYADNEKIGMLTVAPERETSDRLFVHRFAWSQPREGTPTLTAVGRDEMQTIFATSAPVRITIEGDQPRNVVRIEATSPIAEEDSNPFDRLALVGVFTISRTGPTNESLSGWVHYSGTASNGVDYESLPWGFGIPAGATSTVIRVRAIPDGVLEGIETVVAAPSICPPLTDPPLGVPCHYSFDVDPAHERATVFIRDDGLTEASVAITAPTNGARFNAGATIVIDAVAIDLNGYISHVEFFDGDRRIGASHIDFDQAPPPGTPVYHQFEWRGAASGAHTLTARAPRPDASVIVSEPVRITVGEDGNQPPAIAITRPASGTEFPANAAIEVVVETRDSDGYVRTVEFFADGRKLGERHLFVEPPPPGHVQVFTFVWREATPGAHALTARATDDDNASALSAPVEIRVATDSLPMVTVVATDCFAVEPSSNSVLNTASFRLQRFGPTNSSLTVRYTLCGAALNGVDYELLTGAAVIAAGSNSTSIVIRPLADDVREGMENVILEIQEHGDYRQGGQRLAVAVIADTPLSIWPNGARWTRLPDRGLHLCFSAQSGREFRVEASSDLRDWDTVFTTMAVDDAIHFVEEDMAASPLRFYRLAAEP